MVEESVVVIFPLMPKGVEHRRYEDGKRVTFAVIFPLMPKGVEHKENLEIQRRDSEVIFPLMPKGVEHYSSTKSALFHKSGDFPSDAERR